MITIGVNTTAIISNENLFKDDTLKFCVRADLTGRSENYNDSIAFTETVVTLNFNMTANFEIKDVDLEAIDPDTVVGNASYTVDACICDVDGNVATCLAKKLEQNAEFDVCVFSFSDVMTIDTVTNMEMEQNNGPDKK